MKTLYRNVYQSLVYSFSQSPLQGKAVLDPIIPQWISELGLEDLYLLVVQAVGR